MLGPGSSLGDLVTREALGVDDEARSPLRALGDRAGSALSFARSAGAAVVAPLSVPALALAARRTANDSMGRIAAFPAHVRALAAGETPPLPSRSTAWLDRDLRWVITSDLHRGQRGRYDWPARQRTKEVYLTLLRHYAQEGWGLVENGDVEDFWMTESSTWGALSDIVRMAGGLDVDPNDSLPVTDLVVALDRTVDNNRAIYDLLREAYLERGLYRRTVGNHDEAFWEPALAEALGTYLPGVEPFDAVLLTEGAAEAPGMERVDAVITHGHVTDSWNGPVYSPLGRAITWLGMALGELGANGTEGLPDEESVDRLLEGRARNRLITLDPRFGGNRRFDSLDEERLFAALDQDPPPGGWPWLVLGHTHYPMIRPTSKRGGMVKYANSGCGVLNRAVSALEWDASRDEPLRLVLWVDEGDGPTRVELLPDGDKLRVRR